MSKTSLYAKYLEASKLEDCQVSCMIHLGDKLIMADNQTSYPEVKLFGAQNKQIDKLQILEKSRIRDMTKVNNNTFAVATVEYFGWFFFKQSKIKFMSLTKEETLKEEAKYHLSFEITALHFANDLYFIASKTEPCIIVLYMKEDGSQLLPAKSISYKDLSCGLPCKIHVDANYRMIISDSIKQQVVMCTYAPATGLIKNIKCQKFNALDIEPIPDGTILLATAEYTSLVKLFPNANSADNNNIETGCYPCGLAYNKETGKLRVVAKKKPTFWDIISLGRLKKDYIIITYQCELREATDTVIDM